MLDIRVDSVNPDDVVVVLRGELDYATSAQLRAAITALLNRGCFAGIALDLGGVEFLDSIGVGTIVVALRICQQVGVRLEVTAASARAAQLLQVTGVGAALGLPVGTDEEAVVAIG